MTLKVVEPINITEAVLTASDIPEPDASVGEIEWDDPKTLEVFGSYTGDYRASALADNGMIYCVGFDGEVLLINPDDNTLSTFGSYSGSYYTATAAGNGYIYCVGFSGEILLINTSDNTLSTFGTHTGTYYASAIAGNGYIYSVGVSGEVLLIDPNNNTVSTFGSYSGSYNTATLADNGYIYCVGGDDVLLIDTNNNTLSTFGNYTGTYFTSTSASNGYIYCVGFGGEALLINTVTNEVDKIGSYTGTYFTSTIAEDGDIYCLGLDVDRDVLSIDTSNNELSKFGVRDGTYRASTLADNGYIYCVGDGGEVLLVNGKYKRGDRVVLSSTHKEYQCLVKTDESPELGATEDSTATWIVVGPTNKWAMFDGLQNTKTSNSTDFTITLNPITYVNTLAMFGFSDVESVRIEVDNSLDVNIYDKTYSMSDFSAIYDHYTYVFYQIASLDDFIATDLPPLPNTTIRVTFSGSNMTIGELVTGFAIDIGQLVAENTKSDRFRYREQEYNEFGYPTGEAPIVVELNTYDVLVPKLNNQAIQKLLDSITGENTLWVGDIGGGQSLVTYGFFERSPIPYSMPNHINYQITVRASV